MGLVARDEAEELIDLMATGTAPTLSTAATADWHTLTADEVCRRLEVDPAVGLSAAEVTARRQQHGPNKLAEEAKEPVGGRSCASTRI